MCWSWRKMPSHDFEVPLEGSTNETFVTFKPTKQLFHCLPQQLSITMEHVKGKSFHHIRNCREGVDLSWRWFELESSQVTRVSLLAVTKCCGIFNGRKRWGACLSHLIWWQESRELVYSLEHWAAVPQVSQKIFLHRQMSAASGKLRNASFN